MMECATARIARLFPRRAANRRYKADTYVPFVQGSGIHIMLVQQLRVTVDQNASSSNGGQQYTMVIRDVCPQCKSAKYKKNGHTHNGKQNHHCHDCGRQFVQCCEQYLISAEKRSLIE